MSSSSVTPLPGRPPPGCALTSGGGGATAGLRGEFRTELTSLRAEVYSVRDVLRAEMDKNHSEMLHRFADLDTRMTRLENGLGMNRG